MNLQELKDKYAIEKCFESWEDLIYVTIGENDNFLACDKIIEYETEVEVLIQEELTKKAAKGLLGKSTIGIEQHILKTRL